MAVFAIFARNIGNLGHTSGERVAMPTLVSRLNCALGKAALTSAITAAYRHTGNFLLGSPDDEFAAALRVINEQLDRQCAKISVGDLHAIVRRIPATAPASAPSTRWTPGLALLAEGSPDTTSVRSTQNTSLLALSPSAIAVYKRDILTSSGVLDRTRRLGGWGAVANEIEAQVGGRWTARSLSTINGLLRKAVAA